MLFRSQAIENFKASNTDKLSEMDKFSIGVNLDFIGYHFEQIQKIVERSNREW